MEAAPPSLSRFHRYAYLSFSATDFACVNKYK